MRKEFCVISHTHWDREWYFTFEQFRFKLVKLIDNLIDIMEAEPDYIFHLDAQTIVLEDYLKIKPQNRTVLEKYIKEGRIIVGPWYVQNDFFLTDGEATVRNLMIGTEIAESFGRCGNVGYIPDQFGNISQLPQIFNEFGIDSCLFGRGYDFYEENSEGKQVKKPVIPEFYWESGNGSRVFAVRFTNWYNNAQRFSESLEKNLKLTENIVNLYKGTDRTPYYLCMNGVDHLEAQENLFDVLPTLNAHLNDGEFRQCTMNEFVDKAKGYIEENNLPMSVKVGELRSGDNDQILRGTLSSRSHLKIDNCRSQNKLENTLEPICAIAENLGFNGIYPYDYSKYLWKLLIENHPHDSICGCSVDAVHRHMCDRTARFNETADFIVNDVLDVLTAHISRKNMTEEDYIISVWNTSERTASGICFAECNLPVRENFEGFELIDENGNSVPFDVLKKEKYALKTTSPINLPGEIICDSHYIRFCADSVPAVGYKSYIVRKTNNALTLQNSEKDANDGVVLENEKYILKVSADGKISVTDKASGKYFNDFLSFSDTGDKGDLYVYCEAKDSEPIDTNGLTPDSIKITSDTNLVKSCSISYTLNLPKCFDFTADKRSDEKAESKIEVTLSLMENVDFIDISCTVNNASSDHRLRAVFSTGFDTDYTVSLNPYDMVKRDRKDALAKVSTDNSVPNSGLICIGDKDVTLGIMNEGLCEYEHLMGEKGRVALTLLRCTGIIVRNGDRNRRSAMRTEDSQCIGTYSFHMGITFDSGKKSERNGNLAYRTKRFQNPLTTHFQPYSIKKFTGGRPQLQDTQIAELFFRPDKYENVELGKNGSLATVDGENISVTAIKMTEDGKMLLIRAFNTCGEKTSLTAKPSLKVRKASRLTLGEKTKEELSLRDNSVSLNLNPCEIVTLGFEIEK